MSYDNTNKGVLFNNRDAKTNDRQPDYRGSINVGGQEYWLAGWIKEAGPTSKNPGSKFLSLSAEPKEDIPFDSPRSVGGSVDEDIPF